MKIIPLALAVAIAAASNAASADGFYGGVGIGAANTGVNQSAMFGPSSLASNPGAWKVYGGYDFGKYLGAELSYGETSSTKLDSAYLGRFKTRAKMLSLDAVAHAPVTDNFGLIATAGLASVKRLYSAEHGGLTAMPEFRDLLPPNMGLDTDNATKTSLKLGFGAEYEVAKNIGLRGEWTHYFNAPTATMLDTRIVSKSLDTYMLSVNSSF